MTPPKTHFEAGAEGPLCKAPNVRETSPIKEHVTCLRCTQKLKHRPPLFPRQRDHVDCDCIACRPWTA